MTDEQFMNALKAQAGKDQAAGYPDTSAFVMARERVMLNPIIPVFRNTSGTLNRERMLEYSTLPVEQHPVLLDATASQESGGQ